jgi:hypothetical protein
MYNLIGLIKALIPHMLTQEELDQAYLNESVDIFDVERRMAEIDQRSSDFPWQASVVKFNFQ